jgi:FKBP-type peptidyl-prolyl cis-trans isomerase
MKTTKLGVILLSFVIPIAAQTHKTTAAPHATGPTKVTGEGVKSVSGLQYWEIKPGTGQEANKGDHVKVHYTGWLTSGKKFDSSVGGKPFEFRIGNGDVIKGWEEGVSGMKVGGKRQLKIPPDLAYGKDGYPGAIPPNATLVFDIQLVGIQ